MILLESLGKSSQTNNGGVLNIDMNETHHENYQTKGYFA